jgi:hypothetical protein
MSYGTRYFRCVLGSAFALGATVALAGEITLYENQGFHGRFITSSDALPNLQRSAFNDVASSIVVTDGVWEACTDAYFRGRCAQLRPGRYPSLDSTLNNRISSVREIAYLEPQAAVSTTIASAGLPRAVLYQHTRSGVRSVELTGTARDLDRVGFDDRADAITVFGGLWRLCDRPGGQGQCAEYPPGQYDHLGALDGRVRSVELVAAAQVGVTEQPVPRVVLYEFPDFAGRSLAIEGEARNLEWQRFSNRASSIRVEAGNWLFCTGPEFQGDCRTLGPGEYPRLTWNLDRQISSARLVSSPYVG